ncbi:MAG: hypothetical protein WC299_00960 [Kiritimatiellia bacterium]
MSQPNDEQKQFERLEQLARGSALSRFSMSPNDVLVQVSLPLILILAIATRLFTAQDQSPLVLELWKQQVILRVEQALNSWETRSNLAAFPDFSRIQWSGVWPEDPRYQALCRHARDLDNIEQLKLRLLDEALAAPVTVTNGAAPVAFEGLIDEERRRYALAHIEQRCLKWKERVADLQWATVERVLSSLPLGDPLTDRSLEKQMNNLAGALQKGGYPLMNAVVDEYRRKEQAK